MNKEITLVNYKEAFDHSHLIYIKLGNTIRLPEELIITKSININKLISILPGTLQIKGKKLNEYTGNFWVGFHYCIKPIVLEDINQQFIGVLYLFDRNQDFVGSSLLYDNLGYGVEYHMKGTLKGILERIGLSKEIINKYEYWIEYE